MRKKEKKEVPSPPGKKSAYMSLGKFTPGPIGSPIAAYAQSVAIFACVSKIAQAVGGLEFELMSEKGKILDHPLLDVLYYPNKKEGSRSFYQRLASYFLLTGNAYVYIVKVGSAGQLHLLHPSFVEIKTDDLGNISGYRFRGKLTREFKLEEICHLKHPGPGDSYYGQSYFEPLKNIVNILYLTESWNLKLVENDMRPPGILEYEGVVSEKQEEEFRKKFQDMFQGASHAGENVFLRGGLKWKPVSMNIKDADWLNLIKTYIRQIANTLNIPPELMGDAESKIYSNMKEARRAFYLETVLPLCDFIVDEFNRAIVPLWDRSLWLQIDRSKIEAIQDDLEQKARIAKELDCLTLNEQRALLGYQPVDGADVVMVSMGEMPIISVDKQRNSRPSGQIELKRGKYQRPLKRQPRRF